MKSDRIYPDTFQENIDNKIFVQSCFETPQHCIDYKWLGLLRFESYLHCMASKYSHRSRYKNQGYMESILWASMKSQSHCCKFQRHNFRRLQNAPDRCQPGKLQKMAESLAGKTVEMKALTKVDRKAS